MEIKISNAKKPVTLPKGMSSQHKQVASGGVSVNITNRKRVTINSNGDHIDPETKQIIKRNTDKQ